MDVDRWDWDEENWGALTTAIHLQQCILFLGPDAALERVSGDEYRPLTDLVDRAVSPRRFILELLAAFGAVALILAALGIYGVLSYTVAERTPEIGIRMALGESGPHVLRRVVGRTLALAGSGIAIGVALSLVGTRSIRSLLYGVAPTDPVTFAAMMVVLLAIAAFAGFLPARRAARVDPSTAFRSL